MAQPKNGSEGATPVQQESVLLPMENRTVSFSNAEKTEKKEVKMLNPDMRGISMAKCDARCHMISRIPTRVELKTLTHLAKRPAISIDFKDITYSVADPFSSNPENKTILNKVSGSFKSGELTAILGTSGAGKSTLMNILAGYVTVGVSGTIETNGHPRQLKLFNKLNSYIMQDDLLQPCLTVAESMTFATRLKLGKELSSEEKAQVVEETLNTLNLSTAKDTRTECLSGGQRKRLSVALELVSNPPVIFLDEPTTGLDMLSTTQLMALLKVLARQGRTIICTIHQPTASIFETLDLVYIMSAGLCAYQGSHDQLVPFLAAAGFNCPLTYNPADYVMEIITGNEKVHAPKLSTATQNGKMRIESPTNSSRQTDEKITKLCRKETVAIMPKVYNANVDSNDMNIEFPTTFLEQAAILLKRRFLQQSRNKTVTYIMILHHILSSSLVGIMFLGVGNNGGRPFEIVKFVMCAVVFFIYTHVMSNVLLFPFELKRLRREYFNRWYGLKAYFVAHTLSTIPSHIVFGMLFSVVVYTISDQPYEPRRFLWFYGIGLIVGITSEGLGMTVGAIFKVMNGSIAGPACVVPMLALGAYGMGFGTSIEPFMQALMYTSYLRFGITGLSTALLKDRQNLMCPQEELYCHYKNPAILLRDLGMEGSETINQFLALVGFTIFFRITAYLALRHRLSLNFSTKLFTYISKVLKQR